MEEYNMLKENVLKYAELDAQIKELQAQAKALTAEIIKEMEELGQTKYTDSDVQASLVYKTAIKYPDEVKLINQLKAEGLNRFIVETVDNKALNELIKTSNEVATKLNESYTKTTSTALSVKRL